MLYEWLPDMYTQSPMAAGPRVEGVHIRQTTNARGITVMCHNSPSLGELEAAQASKCASLQAHCTYREGCWDRLLVFITGNFSALHL